MPKTSAELKAQAKQQLKGRWGQIIAAILIVMAINIGLGVVINSISEKLPFISLLTVLVSAPLSVGLVSYVLKFIRLEDVEIPEVFSGFNRFGDSVILAILINIFIFLWSLPFTIVMVVLLIAILTPIGASIYSFSTLLPMLLSPEIIIKVFIMLIVIIAMFVVVMIKSLSYSMSYYILVDNPDMKASEALNWSKRITKGHIGRMFYVNISFFGWALLATITAGIGFIWLMPYIYTTLANLYIDLKQLNPEYNAIAPELSQDDEADSEDEDYDN